MRFTPSVYPKVYSREVTARRVHCAEKAVQRQQDSVALFPELLTTPGVGSRSFHRTATERLAAICDGDQERATDFRANRAQLWRRARRELDQLPECTRRGIRRFWNECNLPGDPCYFAETVRHRWGWSRLRQRQQLRLVGQGRLSRDAFARAQAQRRAAGEIL